MLENSEVNLRIGRNKYKQLEDADLLLIYKDKKAHAIIGEIYLRYGHLMFGLCLKYLKNEHDAEDMVSDLFEKLPQKLLNHNIEHFKSWIYMVTKNECLMKLRKKNYATEYDESQDLTEAIDGVAEKQLLELKIESVTEALADIKPDQATGIKLFYIEKMSYTEISNKLGWDIKKVKSEIQNGKRNLKIKLMDHAIFKSAK